MLIPRIVAAIKAGQLSAMEDTFKAPPQDFASFQRRLGFYLGLSEALRFIEEQVNKEDKDD